jgi:hypothetical protein
MWINYPIRSRFLQPCEAAIVRHRDALFQGDTITVRLSPQGYNRRVLARIIPDNPQFFWSDPKSAYPRCTDPSRFGVRLRAAALALYKQRCFGTYEIAHETGVLTIKYLSSTSIQPDSSVLEKITRSEHTHPPESMPHQPPTAALAPAQQDAYPPQERCDALFTGFTFQDLRTAEPPDRKGVYVIRVKQQGQPIKDIVQRVNQIVHTLAWPIVGNKMLARIDRLNRIASCSVIYIGSAGTRPSSKHTLAGRYSDFGGRHTAMYPLWALLYFGWQLEYGWKEDDRPADLEEQLKEQYRRIHDGRLPALVHR